MSIDSLRSSVQNRLDQINQHLDLVQRQNELAQGGVNDRTPTPQQVDERRHSPSLAEVLEQVQAESAGGYGARKDPDQIRNDLLVSVFKSSSIDLISMSFPKAGDFIKAIDRSLQGADVAYNIGQALEADQAAGDTNLTNTFEETQYQLSKALGEELATYALKELLSKNPPAAVLATVLGPELFDSVIYDVPKLAKRIADVTGFEYSDGRISFDFQNYDPREDPEVAFIEKQKELGTSFGKWMRSKLPDIIEGLEDIAAGARDVRDYLSGR